MSKIVEAYGSEIDLNQYQHIVILDRDEDKPKWNWRAWVSPENVLKRFTLSCKSDPIGYHKEQPLENWAKLGEFDTLEEAEKEKSKYERIMHQTLDDPLPKR